jgi:hypothetical protein
VASTRSFALAVAVVALAGGGAGCGGSSARHATSTTSRPRVIATRTSTTVAATTSTTESWEPVTAVPPATLEPPAPPTTSPATTPSSSRSRTSRPTTTVASATACFANDDVLAQTVVRYAQSLSPATPMTLDTVRHARSDATWARADLAPTASDDAGLAVLAHCVGAQWIVVPGGTNDLGCAVDVPSAVADELGLSC